MNKSISWTLVVIVMMMIGVFLLQGCASHKNKEWTPKNIYESLERAGAIN